MEEVCASAELNFCFSSEILGVRAVRDIGGAEPFVPLPKYERLRGTLEGKYAVTGSVLRDGLYIAAGALGICGKETSIVVFKGDNPNVRGGESSGISRGPFSRLIGEALLDCETDGECFGVVGISNPAID